MTRLDEKVCLLESESVVSLSWSSSLSSGWSLISWSWSLFSLDCSLSGRLSLNWSSLSDLWLSLLDSWSRSLSGYNRVSVFLGGIGVSLVVDWSVVVSWSMMVGRGVVDWGWLVDHRSWSSVVDWGVGGLVDNWGRCWLVDLGLSLDHNWSWGWSRLVLNRSRSWLVRGRSRLVRSRSWLVGSRGGLVGSSLRVGSLTLVSNISNISLGSSGVAHNLDTAIGKVDSVLSFGVVILSVLLM
jgi:hypothetical protein